MRVHGDVRILRKTSVTPETDYKKYRESLTEDFNSICGYCGKNIIVSRRGFEIDHFVPISTDATRETDYSNLVLSCFTCNRKKGKKWPTQDKNICHNGDHGFVDPTTAEFDDHLGRRENGSIVHYSNVGQYMHGVFKFHLRPTEIVWKSMELDKRKQQLYNIKNTSKLTNEEMGVFIDIQEELDKLLQYLLGKGE